MARWIVVETWLVDRGGENEDEVGEDVDDQRPGKYLSRISKIEHGLGFRVYVLSHVACHRMYGMKNSSIPLAVYFLNSLSEAPSALSIFQFRLLNWAVERPVV